MLLNFFGTVSAIASTTAEHERVTGGVRQKKTTEELKQKKSE
jgi:hypothetical protein